MRLSEQEAKILVAAQFNALDSVAELREASGCREHQIRYTLNKLSEEGVVKPRLLIDPTKLGLTEYSIALSLACDDETARERLHAYLLDHPGVADVLVLGGVYDLFVMFAAQDVRKLHEFLRCAEAIQGVRILAKQFAIRVTSNFYRRKYLAELVVAPARITFGEDGRRVSLDPLSAQLLEAMIPMSFTSFRDLARSLQIPHTTAIPRIEKLKADGVIVAYIYGVYPQKLGHHAFRLLLQTTNVNAQDSADLQKFCEQHPNIVVLLETVGSWDFELRIEVEHAEQCTGVINQIRQQLGKNLIKLETLPIFRYLKGHFSAGYLPLGS